MPYNGEMEAKVPEDNGNFSFTIPIVKVDKEKREVYGVATAEQLDSQGEVMEYSGSVDAFKGWAGNIREMHQPKAVGRKVEVEYDDAKKQIMVRARVSKGAQDTWEKVLDGTLRCYSVGGRREESRMVPGKECAATKSMDAPPEKVRLTSKWKMAELSLVDQGALPSAKFTLVKNVDGVPMETEIVTEPQAPSRKDFEGLMKDVARLVQMGGDAPDTDDNHEAKALARRDRAAALAADVPLFLAMNQVTKVEHESGKRLAGEDLQLADVEKFVKAHYESGYMTVTCQPMPFAQAYERYKKWKSQDWVYNVVGLLQSVLCNILLDPDMGMKEKKNLVVQSQEEFVNMFFSEAKAQVKATKVADEAAPKGAGMANEEVTKQEGQKPAEGAEKAQGVDLLKSIEGLLGKTVETLQGEIKKVSEAAAEANRAVVERIEKIEKAPAPAAQPVLKVASKDGTQEDLVKTEAVVVKDVRGRPLTPEAIEKEMGDIESRLANTEALPLGAPGRTPLETRYFELGRLKKILAGDGVWDIRRR